MAIQFPRILRVFGILVAATSLTACVVPSHGGYYGGRGGYSRSYAAYQPVHRGYYGGHGGGYDRGHHRGWR